MNMRSFLILFTLGSSALAEVSYTFVPDFIKPPPGQEKLGDSHGEIACDSAGNYYISVQDNKEGGLLVYGPDGKFQKVLNVPSSLHGFVIRKDEGKEYIFAAVLNENRFIKCGLDGTVVMEIPKTAFPEDKGKLKLTGCDVASNGDIYIVDGYGKSWIFVFDRTGKFKKVFGGPVEPWKFENTHKIFIDHRFSPERIVALDRGNNRMLHLDLEGNILGQIASTPKPAKGDKSPPAPQAVRNPSSASFHGDLMCVAEIGGRISVWDKENKLVAELGVNPGFTNTPGIGPKDWQQGMVTSPHGITFDNDGNILETEWNKWGRVLRWNVNQ